MCQSNEYWNVRYVPSFASFVFFPAEQIACELSILGGPDTEQFWYTNNSSRLKVLFGRVTAYETFWNPVSEHKLKCIG